MFAIERTAHDATSQSRFILWVVCAIAGLGFAFDTYEITVLSVVVRPALIAFGIKVGSAEFNRWVGLLFYVPLAVGGVLGLLGGLLTDRLGRRRVLVWSIWIYGVASVGAAYASSPFELLVWRALALSGATIEFVAGVAWVAELFSEPKQRELALGYTQACSALGGFLVTAAYYVAVTHGPELPTIANTHDAWRYTLLFGVAPAIPLMVVRPFLPESPAWTQQKAQGRLQRPRLAVLFHSDLLKATCVTTLLTACSYAIAFGVTQQAALMVPGLSQVQNLTAMRREQTVSAVTLFINFGNLAGRVLFSLLVVRISQQRRLLRIFLLPALIVTPLVYGLADRLDLATWKLGILIATTLQTAQFSFWGNYLPRLYPTHLRGTGESFATNIGGRLLGTSAVFATTQLAAVLPGTVSAQLASAAAIVAVLVYAAAILGTRWLPEPRQGRLPE